MSLRTLYPQAPAFASGTIEVGDGHRLAWRRYGTRGARPAVILHGGPGGSMSDDEPRMFDPTRYDVLTFDQRGCGQSTPFASIEDNTTWHLVEDLERLRGMMGVDNWLVFGGSWGSTLALAYAQTHPERVAALVVRGIFTLRRGELEWYYQRGASLLFPDKWERFLAPIPEAERGDMMAAYRLRLTGPDKAAQREAARCWAQWEGETITLWPPPAAVVEKFDDPEFQLAFARIENHYFVHGGWFEEGQLIRDAQKLRSIPGVIVQGRYDVTCPPQTAWDLHRAWPEAEFFLVEGAGHAQAEPGVAHHLIEATDRLASS